MEIWLSNGTKDKILIPVNPESIGANDTRNFEDVTMSNGDEKTIKSGRQLRNYTIESFFPKKRPHYAKATKIKTPVEYVKKLKKWMDDGVVLRLQVTTTNINEVVTIRSFEWTEKGGAVGDYEYVIELREYEPVSFAKIKVITPSKPKPKKRAPSSKKKTKIHVVKKHECLWKISKKVYGDAEDWRKIYNKNKKIIGKNPHYILPGQRLVIP